MKKIISYLMALLIGFTSSINIVYGEEALKGNGNLPPYNPNYLEYLKLDPEERASIRQPFKYDVPVFDSGISLYSMYPEKYDTRDEYGAFPVRNQMLSNICWTFSGTTNLAYYLLKTGQISADTEFSTRHVDFSQGYIPGQPDFLLGTPNRTVDSGGNQILFMTYIFGESGPVLEEEFPFFNSKYLGNGEFTVDYLPRKDLLITPSAIALDYELFMYNDRNFESVSLETKINQLKYLIYEYGSADIGVFMDEINYYNKENYSYHYSENTTNTNHAVTAIGWDDNYPRENFLTDPGMDGAWIVINSWSEDWGDNGVFYISYADWPTYEMYSSISEAKYEASDSDHRYIYDKSGLQNGYGADEEEDMTDSGYGANIFKKQKGQEYITHINIGTYTTGESSFEIYVADNVSSIEDIDIDNLTPCKPIDSDDRIFMGFGYKTIELEEPVLVTGDSFAVIVKYNTPNNLYPVGCGTFENDDVKKPSKTSYFSNDGKEWKDISDEGYSCSIRAFTKDADQKATVNFEGENENSIAFVYYNDTPIIADNNGSYKLAKGETYIYDDYIPSGGAIYIERGSFTLNEDCPDNVVINTDDAYETYFTNIKPGSKDTYIPKEFAYGSNFDYSWNSSYIAEIEADDGFTTKLSLIEAQLEDYNIDVNWYTHTGKDYMTIGDKYFVCEISDGENIFVNRYDINVEKAVPGLYLGLEDKIYKPGDVIEIDFYCYNINNLYEKEVCDNLPSVEKGDLIIENSLDLPMKYEKTIDSENYPYINVYYYFLEIPENIDEDEIVFTISSVENQYYKPIETFTYTANVEIDEKVEPVRPVTGGGGGSAVAKYNVTFDYQDGSEPVTYTVNINDNVDTIVPPVREGYSFGGWFTDKECTNEYDFSKGVKGNITLYGKWVATKEATEEVEKVEEEAISFEDVDKEAWYSSAVDYVLKNGLMVGTDENNFSPDMDITRAMFTTVLYRIEGSPQTNGNCSFNDVLDDAYYYDSVTWASDNGLVYGYNAEEFLPDKTISREEMAAIIYRYAQLKNWDIINSSIAGYSDLNEISDYALNAVYWVSDNNIMSGRTDGSFCPKDMTTRAEAAAVFERLYNKGM